MKASYNMEFCDGFRVTGCGRFKGLFQGHGVGSGGIFLAAEGAQAAGRDAHVRRIDMAIDVEVGLVAMETLANEVGHPSHSQNVARS